MKASNSFGRASVRALVFAAAPLAGFAPRAAAQQDVDANGVLIVVSDASAISQAIGTYYATVRGIAAYISCGANEHALRGLQRDHPAA
jgi:hypothetical protein